jgi:UDP-N-acetylglucosamine--N-acetylmuramyl-(pentapeptide) pyrophosphoryl-undecaprenol N-acetylglucosamine transferase
MTLGAPTILIMAGGTGGHVFPALAIANELLARGAQVEWLGTRQGIEARVVSAAGIPLHCINISGLRGKGLVKKLLAPLQILVAVVQALLKIRRIRPGCVLGMGGFVTGPGGLAARLLGSRVLIHEQNAVAGLSNQLLFPLAHVVMEAFSGAFARKQQITTSSLLRRCIDPQRTRVVGNPVRSSLLDLPAPQQRMQGRKGPLRLLVVGGSLGAAAINRVLPALLAVLPATDRPLVRHQCGERNLNDTCQWYAEAGVETGTEVEVTAFIDDMAEAYAWADLVVCRAGASTVSELAAIGLPAILVPYPHAVDDHQTYNARVLEQAGAAVIIPQHSLDAVCLAACLRTLADRGTLLQRAEAGRAVGVRDGGSRAATLCLEACHG